MRGAAEFMLTKDYKNNWFSEMNETFTFWSLSDWNFDLKNVGFKVLTRDTASDRLATRVYTNDWIVKNRFESHCAIFSPGMKELPYPPTNVIIVAETPNEFESSVILLLD